MKKSKSQKVEGVKSEEIEEVKELRFSMVVEIISGKQNN